MKSTLSRSDMLLFAGDALVLPCYSDIMYSGKYSWVMRKILEEAGTELIKELSAIGELDLCHACITKGYNLSVKHLIFYACYCDDPEVSFTHLDWHATFKNVSTLVRQYGLETIGIKLPTSLGKPEKNLMFRIRDVLRPKAFEGGVLTILDTVMKSTQLEKKIEMSLYL